MPIFNKKPKQSPTTIQQQYENNNSKTGVLSSSTSPMNSVERRVPQPQPPPESNVSKPQLVFHCQLAHGSPTGLISGFASVKELYQKIAECYDFSVDEVSNILNSFINCHAKRCKFAVYTCLKFLLSNYNGLNDQENFIRLYL